MSKIEKPDQVEFEEYMGKKIPIIWRKKGKEETDPCPFCGKKHIHGTAEGHRVAHCADRFVKRKLVQAKDLVALLKDGTEAKQQIGYIIREYEK